jgi:hypothetical protein
MKKNLGPEEVARLRAGIEDVQRQVRELIAFIQAKLEAGQPKKS